MSPPNEPPPSDDFTGKVIARITKKAERIDTSLAERVAKGGRNWPFPSEAEAREELASHPAVRLQRRSPNDPRDVTHYVVKGTPPEPAPEERGPPAEGWEFRAGPNAVGDAIEAVYLANSPPKPLLAYAARELGWEIEDLDAREHRRLSSIDFLDPFELTHSWLPDTIWSFYDKAMLEELQPQPPTADKREGPLFSDRRKELSSQWTRALRESVLAVYAVEIKHGDASFERTQREAMNELHDRDLGIVPLKAKGSFEGFPQTYSFAHRGGPF